MSPKPTHSVFLGKSHESTKHSDLSQKLQSITGHYAEDYIRPVRCLDGNFYDLLSDESHLDNHYCVSLVIMPWTPKNELNERKGNYLFLQRSLD